MARNSLSLSSPYLTTPESSLAYSPPTMAAKRLNLPPVPSAARIIQPANKDTALFILQSVLKTGARLPAGKWTTLIKLLWDSPQTQVPSTVSTGSGPSLGIPGTSRRLSKRSSAIMGSSTPSRTPTLPPSRPWPRASAARRRWRHSRTASIVMPPLPGGSGSRCGW